MSIAVREAERVIAGRPVAKIAKDWGIPRYVLVDWLRRKSKYPSARYLPAIAKGMGRTVEELIQLCAMNGADGESPLAPQEDDAPRP